MNAVADIQHLSGMEQLRAIFTGRTGYEGIVKTLDIHPVSADGTLCATATTTCLVFTGEMGRIRT